MMETAQPEPQPEEDELPAYTEVVQGASIARASNSKEPAALTSASSPPGQRGSRDANYRPDVQLQ